MSSSHGGRGRRGYGQGRGETWAGRMRENSTESPCNQDVKDATLSEPKINPDLITGKEHFT